jgi:hypothetical protein
MYSIYRSQEAATALHETWERADEPLREAICRALRRADRRLHEDPQEQGESREKRTRILFQHPLGVLFEVDEERKLVVILRTWTYAPVTGG